MLDTILWMRSHNQNPGNAPRGNFRSFYMQSSSIAIDNVIDYFHNVGPEDEEEVITLYAPFRPYANDEESYSGLSLLVKLLFYFSTKPTFREHSFPLSDLLFKGRTTFCEQQ